jgi:hypothetical protein
MVVNGQTERQLALGLSPSAAVQTKPKPMRAPASIQNSAQLKIETGEFLLSKMNSAFNSFLSLLEKARPEAAGYFRIELCRIFSARIEGKKAILENMPSKGQMREAQARLYSLEMNYAKFNKRVREDSWKWNFVPEEEQNTRYALDRYCAMCLLAGLYSLFEKREYEDFILVLDLYEKEAREAAAKREYGKPRVSKYEVYICHELQLGISGKVKQLAEIEKN